MGRFSCREPRIDWTSCVTLVLVDDARRLAVAVVIGKGDVPAAADPGDPFLDGEVRKAFGHYRYSEPELLTLCEVAREGMCEASDVLTCWTVLHS